MILPCVFITVFKFILQYKETTNCVKKTPHSSVYGKSTVVMLVETLVERVFLVSGMVKTLFPPNKKIRDFFLFSPRTKKSKADFVGISELPLFATETHRIFWNFVEFFF